MTTDTRVQLGTQMVTLEYAERCREAAELRSKGLTYAEIAKRMGWKQATNAQRAVRLYLSGVATASPDVAALREMEGMKLDHLWRRALAEASKGDVRGIQAGVRIVEVRAKLFGLNVDESRMAAAAEMSAAADLAMAASVIPHLIGALQDGGLDPAQQSAVIAALNGRLGMIQSDESLDDETEVVITSEAD